MLRVGVFVRPCGKAAQMTAEELRRKLRNFPAAELQLRIALADLLTRP
jgi:hypothetical protein